MRKIYITSGVCETVWHMHMEEVDNACCKDEKLHLHYFKQPLLSDVGHPRNIFSLLIYLYPPPPYPLKLTKF